MNCENYLLMLDEYVENELDEISAAQVSAHLADCAECARLYKELKREHQAYSQCFPDIEAPPELWANIQADIEKIGRERFSLGGFLDRLTKTYGLAAFNPMFAAASFALLIAIGIIVAVKYGSTENSLNEKTISQTTAVQSSPEKTDHAAGMKTPNSDKKDSVSEPENKFTMVRIKSRGKKDVSRRNLSKRANQFVYAKPVDPNREPTIAEVVEKVERQYKGAIAILANDIRRRRGQLPPNFITQFGQPLAEIDRTINETRRAVRAQPNDAAAVQYMTTAYAKKIELLRTIAGK